MNARRVRLRRALGAVGLELRDDSYLCRLYVAEAAFEREWPTLPDVVRRLCEMEWLHEWTPYHAALRRVNDYRRAEALVLAGAGGFPSEWPWQRRAHLLARALAGLRCRRWLRRWLPRWIERFYDPDRGRYLAIAAASWKRSIRLGTDSRRSSGGTKRRRRVGAPPAPVGDAPKPIALSRRTPSSGFNVKRQRTRE